MPLLRLRLRLGFVFAALFTSALHAATVRFVGVITNDAGSQISQWRTAGTAKALDGDGDDVFGTTARVMFGIGEFGQGTVFSFDSSDRIVGPSSGYVTVDDVNGGADVVVATTTNDGVPGADDVMFTFTALAGCPENVRIGIATDGLDGAQFSPASIGLRKVGGSSAEQAISADSSLDMVFFDVRGVVEGEQFQVFGDTGMGNFATIQFVTFDALPSNTPIVVANATDAGPGSLRAALATAAAQEGPDTIIFAPAMNGKTIMPTGPVGGSAFDLTDTEGVSVDASALSAGVKIDGGLQNFRLFQIGSGSILTLRCLTLANGGGARSGSGGAIRNDGTLTLSRCTLSGNVCFDGGGAIFNSVGKTATLMHCTLVGNSVSRANGYAGAIYNSSLSTLVLTHCTVTGNAAGDGGGGVFSSGMLRLTNTIVAGNTAARFPARADIDNFGTITLIGANIVPFLSGSTGTGSGTRSTIAPSLATLGHYSGPTPTRPPLPQAPTNPAIDAATAIAGLLKDQRGEARGAAIHTNDFSAGLGGATAHGAGVLDSGSFRLTPELNDQQGTLVLPDVGSLAGFALSFDYQFSKAEPTSALPADGMSISIGPRPSGPVNDLGLAGTPRVRFDIYNGGVSMNGAIYYIRPDGAIGQANTTALSRDKAANGGDRNVFRAVRIDFTAAGELTVRYKGAVVLGPIATGYTVQAGDTITFGARNGGLSAEQRIDNIGLITQPVGVADIGAVEALSGPVAAVVTSNLDSGPGTLRDMLTVVPTGSIITFDPEVFTGAAAETNTISLFTSELSTAFTLHKAVTIDATGITGGVKLDGGSQNFRFFSVSPGTSLTLCGLTLANGRGTGGFGFIGHGGAIYNSGTLTLVHCTLSGNSTRDYGGAIFSDTSNITPSSTTLSHCTLSGNTTESRGGAIYNYNGRTTLTHCTLSENTAPAGSGSGLASYGDTFTETRVQNCIISGNTDSSVDIVPGATNSFTSLGGNLIGTGNATGDFNAPGDLLNNSPLLAPLAHYGGPTQTMALLPTSPARNAATGSTATSDQRGFGIIGTPDIGAYEAGNHLTRIYNVWIYETLPASATAPQHASTFDFDHDGQTNEAEWLSLTDAANPNSRFTILSLFSNLRFSFPTALGRNYTVETSPDLTTWTPISAFHGTGHVISTTIGSIVGIPQMFLRVKVTLP